MTLFTLARRSLAHHARAHLGAILGSAVAAAVLIGALVVGDSVRESLRQMALARLGKTDLALASNDRLFTTALGSKIARNSRSAAASVLQLPGVAVNSDASTRANNVQVLGVAEDFWKFASEPQSFVIPPDGAILNEALARHLRAGVGDSVLLRVQKPSQLSQDAPLAKAEDHTVALRVNVERIATDAEFGRFGLQASQLPPFNAFVNREVLQARAGVTNKANLILIQGPTKTQFPNELIQKLWTPADAELDIRDTPDGKQIELRTSRIFIDAPVAEAAGAAPQRILTYFVNELRLGEKATPYSMVTAVGTNLAPNEIIINQWLAEDLGAKPGDELKLAYYVVGPMRRLVEETAAFKVKEIVPIAGFYSDRTLMPDFPGMADAKNCRDWDTGFPIKTDAIRDKDEKYWDDHRGTPKAFINLARGQELWGNRFGNLTALRWTREGTNNPAAALLQKLDPASVGLKFEAIRAQALAASSQGQDFGELFLSFSFFLIVAALMLMTLLFGFSIEQRAPEMGTLLAIGLSPKQVRRLLLFEGAGLAIVGAIFGLVGGIIYAKALLAGLSTIWQGAVGTTALHAHILPKTVAIGAASSILVAIATIAWSIRKEARRPARELLTANTESDTGPARPGKIAPAIAAIFAVGALALAALGLTQSQPNPGQFFGAGAMALIAAILFATNWMRRQNAAASASLPTLRALGLRNIARRRKRSRAVLILLGSGAFLIASVGAFRLDTKGGSGTGGFAYIGESALPIVHDLNSAEGRDFYSLGRNATNFHFVPFRVRAGDDASCLNLNKAQKPRLLGADPETLRGRFQFASGAAAEWSALAENSGDPEVVPAIGDAASIQWALKAKIGDTIDYADERGRIFKIKLVGAVANSLLQGNLIIAEKNFIQRFPTEAGYRMFLIDAPSNLPEDAARDLTRAFQDYGLELTRAADRLAAFNAVQNTYINTFQVLGGLGLLLGSFGLGVVVLRNVFERRGELALLQAVGFTPGRIRRLILGEHAFLMALGLLIGAVAALLAALPQFLQSHAALPLLSLAATLGGVVIFGLAATWLAASLALRGNLLDSLRSE
jgi:ABC-type antimicrobial peptide transport system permease subunit